MPLPTSEQPQQRVFQRVIIAFLYRLQPNRLAHRLRNGFQRAPQPVVRMGSLGEGSECDNFFNQIVDGAIALEALVLPLTIEIAPFIQRIGRGTQNWPGPLAISQFAAAEYPAYTLARGREHRLEPALESGIEKTFSDVVRGNLEHRIDARGNWMLAQEVAAKGMDRADARLFELFQTLGQPLACNRIEICAVAACMLNFCSQAEFQFARGLLL